MCDFLVMLRLELSIFFQFLLNERQYFLSLRVDELIDVCNVIQSDFRECIVVVI